jgi:hypothetical protein
MRAAARPNRPRGLVAARTRYGAVGAERPIEEQHTAELDDASLVILPGRITARAAASHHSERGEDGERGSTQALAAGEHGILIAGR